MALPIIDIANGFAIKMLHIKGMGVGIHALFMILMLFHARNRLGSRNNIWCVWISAYMFAQAVITNVTYGLKLTYNIADIVKYIYFFLTLITLDTLRDKMNWNKLKKIYTWLYPMGSILPRALGISLSSYGSGEGSLGFMYSMNSYTFVMIVAVYWSLEMLMKKFNWTNIVRTMLCLLSVLMIGSKSGYLFTAIVFMQLMLRNMKGKGGKRIYGVVTMVTVVLIVFMILQVYQAQIRLIYNRIFYFYNLYGTDSLSSILNFATSARWDRISEYFPDFIRYPWRTLFGLGYGFFAQQVTTEMDVFNLLYLFGVVGIAIYTIAFARVSRITRYKNQYKELLILLFVYLFFGGHVLADVMANNLLAIVVVMGQQALIEKKQACCPADKIGRTSN